MKPGIVIIGAGGHGKVVCDTIIAQNQYDVIGFVDASISVGEVITRNYKVIAAQDNLIGLKNSEFYFIVAIGDNLIRERLFLSTNIFLKSATVIHPTAIIGSNVTVGEGCVILANTVINSCSIVGKNTIINSGVVVDHDCIIGANTHLSLGTMVGSNSQIPDKHTSCIGDKIVSFSIIS